MGETMWKAFLLLVCVVGSTVLISCEDATNPADDIEPGDTESTVVADGTSTDCTRTSGCGGHPPICPKNEVYYNCSGGCIPRQCSEIGFPLNCGKKCTPGCVCKGSYVRADNGTCIPIPDCPSCGGDKNAQQGCGNNCGRTCSDYNKPAKPCPPGCIFNGCNCRKGFVYDNNVKSCVKPEDCTPICQDKEEYSPCINGGCVARNCSQIGIPVPCVKLNPKYCIKGCVCVTGYLRNSSGICVPKELCAPKCDKPNEVYDICPAPCPPKRCNVDERVIDCAPPPKPGDPECLPGCRCADKYYRNATGTCVLKKNCEKPLNCVGPNEVYDPCPGICPPQECGVNPALILCMRNPEYGDPACRPSCVCYDGYVRNDAKKCIPRDKCPKCDGLNEYWEKCIQGCSNQTCESINQTYFCPYQNGCKSGCRCSPGFYRNASNVCVPEDECPKTCGKNERWHKCYYSCGGNESCEDIGKSYSCPAQQKCLSGCRCDKGYWRNTDNVCIPESECPKPCGKNEYFEKCIQGCTNQSCNELGHPPPGCPLRIVGQCKSGCRCKPKHYRNSDGVCIPEAECPRCGWNELWVKCIEDCSNQTCADVGKVIHCPERPAGRCKSGCRCREGAFRNASNVCVPKEVCPKPDCPSGEIWNWCPTIPCDGDYCPKTRDSPQTCPVGIVCDTPRCVCAVNRKRDWKTGKCIPITDCPKFKCDCNEEYQACPALCPGEKCSDYINNSKCPPGRIGILLICRPQCKCIKGYYRDDNGTCIPACHCPSETTSVATTAGT